MTNLTCRAVCEENFLATLKVDGNYTKRQGSAAPCHEYTQFQLKKMYVIDNNP